MGIAVVAVFILPDLPTNTRGFTADELEVAQLRMTEDVGLADVDPEGLGTFGGLTMALKDIKVYIMCIVFTTYVIGLSFNAYFVSSDLCNLETISANIWMQPSLTKTLGFGYVPTLLMSAPPWVFACMFSVAVAWSSDRRQEKVSFYVLERSTHSKTNPCCSSGTSSALFAWVSSASSSASQPPSLPRDTLRSSSKQVHTLGTLAI
jgi:hypothetical protein